MKINRIILLYEKCGLPTKEKPTDEIINIHLLNKDFETPSGSFPFKSIKHIRGNLYRLDCVFGTYDYCFRPKWYQCHKLGVYYLFKLFPKILALFNQ